ncbi:sigma-70 family RNA polymerase sigma factor [Streptomyces sp. NPDC087212]|uniref:sigma-70 family RNA polymerase sigma factor n=1 Tax=Streptomyces sp. NPDC087212 TaxID=3365766 RepID=UPI0037FB5A7E
MTQLTHAHIAAAKENCLDAVTVLIRETEALVSSRARKAAGFNSDSDLVEDLTQTGRIVVWQEITKFTGTEPAQFMAHIDRAISRAMEDARREAIRPGVAPRIAKAFEDAISKAGGDAYEAERIATTNAMGSDKMSPELARAARLSWLGVDSLDRPFDAPLLGPGVTLGDVVAAEMELPTELVTASDVASHRREVIQDQVHRALGALSERQRHVIKAGFGITPVAEYRPGVDDDELAADMGATRYQVQQARTKGAKRFSELYRAGARAW